MAASTNSPLARERKRRLRRVALVAGPVLILAAALAGWRVFAERPDGPLPELETELPEFAEPAPSLPRAPSHSSFGLELGAASLAQVQAELGERGIDCDDTSVRASMERLRAHKREQLRAAEDPDVVSGASILHRRSPKERNPQVRLACRLEALASLEPGRPGVGGRALFIFDSPEHPLRHASLRRSYTQPEAAMLDLRGTLARFEAIYGPPSSTRGTVPLAGDAPEKLEPIRVEWRYADLLVRVSATNFGRQISIDERVEVPWPIRADAPVDES